MSDPPSIDEVPWREPAALEKWIRANRGRVTPVALTRLLASEHFEEAAAMPTHGPVKCVVWKHEKAAIYPELTKFNVTVYYTEAVSERNHDTALETIDRFRRWKLNGGIVL